MRVLILGSGGREHALAERAARSRRLSALWCLPGNPGTARLGTNVPGNASDPEQVLSVVRREGIDLTIVGPEDPLAAGVVDALLAAGRRALGPTAAAARLEWDKAFAKQLMKRVGVPTADARIFAPTEQEILHARMHRGREAIEPNIPTAYRMAREYVSSRDEGVVVKAAGLARGKGVFVCADPAEALGVLERIMVRRELGAAADTVLVEERLTGREVSVLALVAGRSIYTLESARDYKRLRDGDQGPNTGGMGAYSPLESLDDATLRQIESQVFVPIVDALLREGTPYHGVLYAGLMLTPGGPRVLEFNCRLGDPEAQVILSRLRSDLLDVCEAAVEERLDEITLDWDPRPAVCVVLASRGYPDAPVRGQVISGLSEIAGDDLWVYHAGTALRGDALVTDGGRVLGVTALGATLADARQRAYAAAGRIRFDGAQLRGDIASG